MRRLVLASALLLSALAGCTSPGRADVVLETDRSPLTDSDRLNIERTLGDTRNFELLGRVLGPQGESILVTFGQGEFDSCYAVFEGPGYSAGCGSLEPPTGSVLVGQSYNEEYIGLIVDTSQQGITSVRITTGTGETYEVAPLSQRSFIIFQDTESGFELSLIAGDEIVHQEG